MLAKFVGADGVITVNADWDKQKLFKKNLVSNDVDKVVTLEQNSDTINSNFDFLFENSYQNVNSLYSNG